MRQVTRLSRRSIVAYRSLFPRPRRKVLRHLEHKETDKTSTHRNPTHTGWGNRAPGDDHLSRLCFPDGTLVDRMILSRRRMEILAVLNPSRAFAVGMDDPNSCNKHFVYEIIVKSSYTTM
jgi:hypothetical protein